MPDTVGGSAEHHVTAFNAAVVAGDFTEFLGGFADDAVIKFENVPGAGSFEYSGRAAYEAAYTEQPPDDQIDIVGPVHDVASDVIIPFAWRRAPWSRGTLRLSRKDGQVSRMIVTFH